jgi:hypothetical protein
MHGQTQIRINIIVVAFGSGKVCSTYLNPKWVGSLCLCCDVYCSRQDTSINTATRSTLDWGWYRTDRVEDSVGDNISWTYNTRDGRNWSSTFGDEAFEQSNIINCLSFIYQLIVRRGRTSNTSHCIQWSNRLFFVAQGGRCSMFAVARSASRCAKVTIHALQ